MSVELTVALVSAAAAVLAALLTVMVSARTTRVTAEFQDKLERQRHQASKEELLEQVMSRYRCEPLVRAAFDLQSRIYNIVKQRFLVRYLQGGTPVEQEYACRNTIFVLAEYLGWVEILRRGVQFLDLGDVDRNRSLVDRLEAISTVLLADRPYPDSTFQVFRGQQRAVGELMMDPAPPNEGMPYRQCIGYAAFVAKLEQEPTFARWFAKLEGDVQQVAADPSPGYDRLVALQHALIDLIDFLDDPPTRFPHKHRAKI